MMCVCVHAYWAPAWSDFQQLCKGIFWNALVDILWTVIENLIVKFTDY